MSVATTPARPREALIVIGLLFIIAAADAGLRLVEHRLSGNLAHIAELQEIIDRHVGAGPAAVLLVGNSLTNNGVDESALEGSFGIQQVAKVTPDATSLWDWQCLLDNRVLERGVQFDTIVIGFAWRQLSDQTTPDASRLGAFYCELSDIANPESIGLSDIAGVGEFVAAKTLRLYAVRDTLRNRTLSVIIPGYEEFTQQQNRRAGDTGAGNGEAVYSFEVLRGMAERVEKSGARLVLVAMPVQDSYELDSGLLELARERRIALLDYRSLDDIDTHSFRDSMHLNERGQAVLTARLAADLRSQRAALGAARHGSP